jgi:hypothetical protein
MEARKVTSKVTPGLDEQFVTGRLYGTQINKILFPHSTWHSLFEQIFFGFLQLAFLQDLAKVVDAMVTF